jgi:predicted YcjX-like family ATPase
MRGQISDTVFGAPIRLDVTGLARSGKTVFITSLVVNMLEGGRMPQLSAMAQGRIVSSYLQPQLGDTVARFDQEQNIDLLIAPPPVRPENTRAMSQLRLSLKIRPSNINSGLPGTRVQHIDLIDYPEECILDLVFLTKSYSQWCDQVLARMKKPSFAQDYLNYATSLDCTAPFDEAIASTAAKEFRNYLKAARSSGLSDLASGRFLLPRELTGSPVLTLAPLLKSQSGDRKILWQKMERRYNAFRSGRNSLIGRLFTGPLIDRIVFGATKADHLHQDQHEKLTALMQALTDDAARRADIGYFFGKPTIHHRRDPQTRRSTDRLCTRHNITQRKKGFFFAGKLPEEGTELLSKSRNGSQEWLKQNYSSMTFFSPNRVFRLCQGIVHIRLDKAAEFLFEDKL